MKLSRRPDGICLSVADHGPGVPLDRREDVVKRFVRLDESRSKPGTGLGLSLVEAIMELHGGTLELSDTDSGNAQRPGLDRQHGFPRTGRLIFLMIFILALSLSHPSLKSHCGMAGRANADEIEPRPEGCR